MCAVKGRILFHFLVIIAVAARAATIIKFKK
jgi:hypothetical protein